MNSKRTLRQVSVALVLLVAFLFQGTWALAGTTGGINGTVTDVGGAPIAGATVKAVSASQQSTASTDASGHFQFLSLSPDTYTVSVEKDQYSPVSFAGVSVFADQAESLSFKMEKSLKTIAKVTSRAAGALIKPGTTSDVYSVNAASAAKVTGLGGGGSLDQAYSAIATVPGAYVPVGGAGWYQSVYIRGGDYDQIGYEVDGVPVNRSFDNYPSNTASALGQQEVQVYTGASPANSEGQGLSGYINQVIRTGTYPGFGNSDLGIGSPAYYHKANIEAGGASPDRLFSYYVGFGGYNQDHRFFDNNNGASISSLWGTPVTTPANGTNCGTLVNPTPAIAGSCYLNGTFEPTFAALGPYVAGGYPDYSDRENVMNFHFAIPHHHDSGRDDFQILYQDSDLKTYNANSPSDYTNALFTSALGTACYVGGPGCLSSGPLGLQYNGALGQQLTDAGLAAQAGSVIPYYYPSSNNQFAIPLTSRDNQDNAIGMVKVQYQKNFGSDAYLRVYGYTLYSDWFNYGPNTLYQAFAGAPGFGPPFDYELTAHSRGVSATFAKQFGSKNLVNLQGSYSTATSLRDNNTQMYRASTVAAVAVAANNPFNGVCYDSTGAPTACASFEGGAPDKARLSTLYAAQTGGALPTLPGSCGGSTCTWLTVDNGLHATYNTVTPKFGAVSLTDEWDPSDKLHINLGLRYDTYTFQPQNTDTGVRNFWFNAWNNTMCYDTNNRIAGVQSLPSPVAGGATTAACQAAFGSTFAPAVLSPVSFSQTFNVWQPRVGATYTLDPQNVLRFSYGKYDQAPNTAFEQYNTLQQDLPAIFAQGSLGGFNLFGYGRNAPTYPIRPEISYNTDLSLEHQFKGTDMSFKLTPFYRKTQDQIEQFFLDVNTGFVSGLNVGSQTSQGVEFQFQKGDFSRNGLAALLSYTYTNAKIKYSPVNGSNSILDTINQNIVQYNAYTSFCASNPTSSSCSFAGKTVLPTNGATAAPCYTAAGAPDPACAAGDVANPYWNDSPKAQLDPSGSYAPYDIFPATEGAGSYGSFVEPNVATLVVNYKHDKWAVTPALQYSSGSFYGYPLSTTGVDPALGCAPLAGVAPNTARNPGTYTAGGSAYDASTCASSGLYIPNPNSGTFDTLGAFKNPYHYTMSAQFTYEVSPRLTAVLTLANIFDSCGGGTTAAWTNVPGVSKSKTCGYGAVAGGALNAIGNAYNPGQALQPISQYSYAPQFSSLPFNAFLDFKIKL